MTNVMFTFAIPVAMYRLFDRGETADLQSGRGNVSFYVMTSLAAYGAVVAATTVSAQAASETMLGWGRQLALTRQRPLGFIANKVAVALLIGAFASGLVFAVGSASGAQADVWWV
ncbi:MAG: hypothetical protein Q4D79_00775 [Propionibacteriaceae bacterium]|nr:hypothetical protein [Propionibacteriaceae bacterium]